ncbi:MAG: hypothetical protein ACR2Q4_04915 [Geminicoccaceae bacterium]
MDRDNATPPDDRTAAGNGGRRRGADVVAVQARRRSDDGALKKLQYSLLNLVRWSILSGLLIFLLSAILAMHEALNFQDRVVALVSNDQGHARRVFGVLDDTIRNPENYPEDQLLPYASLAVRLDRLEAVQRQLDRFEITEVKVGDSDTFEANRRDESDARQNPGDRDQVDAEALVTAEHSDRALQDMADQVVINGQINALNGKFSDLQQPATATTDQARADKAAIDQAKAVKAAADFEQTLKRLEVSVADLEETLKGGDPSLRIVGAFHKTRKHIKDLGGFRGEILSVDDQTVTSTPYGAHAAEHPAIAEAANKFELDLVARDLERMLDAIEQEIKTLPVHHLLTRQLDDVKTKVADLESFYKADKLEFEPQSGNEPPRQDLAQDVKKLSSRIDEMAVILSRSDPGYAAASQLATLINRARGFSDGLNDMDVSAGIHITYREDANAKPSKGTEAQAAFQQVRGDLAVALQDLEKQIGRRTRVMAVADQLPMIEDDTDDGRRNRALSIVRDFDAVGRFQGVLMPLRGFSESGWLTSLSGLGIDPQKISTLHRETLALLFVFIIGAIGSVIYITKYSIQLVLEGNWLTDRPKRSLAWFLFRPFFGVIVALASFLLFKAGQLALGNNGVLDGSGDFNLPVLSVIALFAGLLSWQALEAIETRGATWFRSQKRQYLWATGLDNGLRAERHSRAELASSIGRSVDQVFRWLTFRDRVSPEMQDRIADWLEVPYNQLFQNEEPQRKPLWLRVRKLPNEPEGIEPAEFREKLASERFDEEKLSAWLDQREPVPPSARDRIVLAMDRRMNEIFTDQPPIGDG